MLIADGGGGYGGTDWMSKDVRFMWSTIAGQDTTPHYEVVEGWRKTADLTIAHLTQVQMYRDNLASVWPPTKSPASAAYLERLDRLIADLKSTHDAASANYTAFSTVTLTLSMARNKLQPILQEYEANERLNLEWKTKQDEAAAKKPVLTPTFAIPPVSSSRQEQLNNQARAIMYDLSSTVISGQAALQKPKVYDPKGGITDDGGDGRSDPYSGSTFATPPVIPPPGSSTGSLGSTHSPSPGSGSAPVHPVTSTPPGVGPTSGGNIGGGGGPILGGIGSPPVIAPPNPGVTPPVGPTPSPNPILPSPNPGLIPPPIGGGLTSPQTVVPNSGRPNGGAIRPGMGAGAAGRLSMPSGGVIGATPGSGMIGQMPGGSAPPRAGVAGRATNPVGGVIGQQQGTGPAGRGGSGHSSGPHGPMASQSAQRRTRRDGATDQTHWDPDNPWATEEGVDPVVLPPDNPPPIDPGPAIGYRR